MFARYLDDPYTPVEPRAREDRSRHLRLRRRRIRRAGDRRAPGRGRREGRAHRREGRRLRRHLVLEPLSRRAVRHGVDGLHAAARRDRPRPTEKYAHAPEILAHCRRIGRHFGLYDNALFHTEVEDLSWDAGRSRWVVRTNRGDGFTAQFIGHGHRSAACSQAARHPGHRDVRRALLPHQPLGLRLYRRRSARRADDEARRQARRHHRHRRHGRSVRSSPRASGEGALRLPAHALVGRRPRQRTDRSRLVRLDRLARLAAALAGELHGEPGRRDRDGGPGAGRLDRPVAPHPPAHPVAAQGAADARGHAGGVRGRRSREDGGDPRPRRRDRPRSGDGAEPEGLVPPALQAALLPRRLPAGLQPAGRPSGRQRRQGRGAHHGGRRGRGRRGVSAGLPDLRLGLRGRHRISPPRRVRPGRPRRPEALAALEGGDAHQARHARPWLPQRLLRAADTGREPDLQRPAQPDRGRPHHRDRGQARPRPRLARDRGDEGGRGRLGEPAADGHGPHDSAAPTARPATTTTKDRMPASPRAWPSATRPARRPISGTSTNGAGPVDSRG